MILGCEFKTRLHSKLDGKDRSFDGRKTTKIIKTAKRGKSHQKIFKKRIIQKSH